MRAYTSLVQQQRREEAFQHVQKAVELAEKIQPHDPRLITCLEALGEYNLGRNPAAAQKAFERELQVAQEIFGPESPNMTTALQMLGQNAAIQHDYATAEKFFFRAVDLNKKFFGEGSEKTAETLVQATSVYFMQKDYAKAEPYLLRAVKIDEALFGPDGVDMLIPRGTLCGLYDRWEQADKAASCNRVLLTILEKQYGDQSPLLVDVLAREAKDLRTLGHAAEADKFDQRATTIRTATMNPN
jgi:tetratricopeptide (TPR) repeat protein